MKKLYLMVTHCQNLICHSFPSSYSFDLLHLFQNIWTMLFKRLFSSLYVLSSFCWYLNIIHSFRCIYFWQPSLEKNNETSVLFFVVVNSLPKKLHWPCTPEVDVSHYFQLLLVFLEIPNCIASIKVEKEFQWIVSSFQTVLNWKYIRLVFAYLDFAIGSI
jgi:hypothetical protein